jgi:type IV secretion system protein VirB10
LTSSDTDVRSPVARPSNFATERPSILETTLTEGAAGAPGGPSLGTASSLGAGGVSTGAAGALGGESDPNLQGRKNAFLEGTGRASETVTAVVEPPRSPYELEAGTIVPAVLITGINSDLPGPIVGQVRENVYDSVSGNTLLIPQGARLLANYDSMVVWGQERVLVCWNRLIFPNGDSIALPCMPAADLQGAAGLADGLDEHWWKIVKGASVAALLAATTTLAAGNTTGYNPTVPQVMARNGADSVNGAGQQITGRNLNIQPTITVRPGFSVNVILTKDLVIPPYAG